MHVRAISSRAVAAVSRFPSRGSRNLWLSVEAFSRGFATRLSHDVYPLGCLTCHRVVSRPWLESRGSAGKLVSLLWTEHLGDSGNGGTTLEFLSPFLWRAPPLEMRQNAGNSFPTTQGKDPSSRARRQKRVSSGCGRDSRASFRVEPGKSGNFLSCSKGVKDPLEVPELRCD